MAGTADLEKRIKTLESIEAIKAVKASYWYCVDRKLWDDFVNVFADDVVFDRSPDPSVKGNKTLAKHLAERLGKSSITTVHLGYAPDIQIMSDTTAKGRWAFGDIILNSDANTDYRGWGIYNDEYVFENGKWRIKYYKITRLLSENVKRVK